MIGHVVILIAVIAAVKSDEECDGLTDSIHQCFVSYPPPPHQKWVALPDENFLKEQCSPLIQRMECIKDGTEKCREIPDNMPAKLEHLDLYLNFFHSVCDEDSELRKGYVENVGCYNSVFQKMIECENSTTELVRNFIQSVREDPESEDIISGDCLSVPMLSACVVLETTMICGEEATSPLERILDSITSITKQIECADEDELVEWEARFILYVAEQALQLKK